MPCRRRVYSGGRGAKTSLPEIADTKGRAGWRRASADLRERLTKVVNRAGAAISTNTYNALGQRVRDKGDGTYNTLTVDEAYGAGGSLLWRYTGSSTDPNQRAS